MRSPAKPIAEPGSKHFSLNCAVYISEIEITSALTQIDRLSLKLLGDPWHDTYLEVDWMGRPDQTQTFIDWVLRSSGLYSSQYLSTSNTMLFGRTRSEMVLEKDTRASGSE